MQFELSKKQKAEGSAKKKHKLELSTIGWVATIAVLLIGVTWVFIFGVLVGRGYRPEQTVPELARIMPSDKKDNATAANNEVLKAEELQFYDSLKEDAPAKQEAKPSADTRKPVKTPESATQQAAKKQTPPAQTQASQTSATQKAAQAPAKQTAKKDLLTPPEPAPTNEQAQPAASATQKTAAEATEDQQRYNYIYQVAAFADPKSAESFRNQVSGLGFESHVEESQGNGKTWHRVMVHFQGRPEDTRQLKAKLAEIGVTNTIMRQKKPL